MIEVLIADGDGKTFRAKVNSAGELAVGHAKFDEAAFNEMDLVDTAYSFFAPKPRQAFVITYIVAFADKDINDASDTVISIYGASTSISTTVDQTLFQFGMGKLTTLPIGPLNLKVEEGKYLNAKTGDDDIHMTIIGHYIDE